VTQPVDRGRIVPPDLDDRTWQDLVDEMRALIPKYAPQWTDHNPSDLGVTLIELFAWLGEGIIYRLNRTPEKNFLAFLTLLGTTRDPATPASTFLTFTSGAGPVTVPAGTKAQTAASLDQQPVVFETDEDATVLPISLTDALIVGPYATAATTAQYDVAGALVGPPAAKLPLTLQGSQSAQLCFGFDQATTQDLVLRLRLYRPSADATQLTASWVYAKGTAEPLAWTAIPGASDATESLRHDGSVRLKLPGDWAAQRPSTAPGGPGWTTVTARDAGQTVTTPRFWVGLRLANTKTTPLTIGIDRVLFNAAGAHNALTIPTPEPLGQSTGQPFQIFGLAHRPLFRRPDTITPYDHLTVQVGVGKPPVWQTWTAVPDLPPGPGAVYRVDPVTAEISFGSYDEQAKTGHGTVPPAGSQIRALAYKYVAGGVSGNVAPGRVTILGPTPGGGLPAGITTVTNLGPGLDGSDEEALEDTLRRAPDALKVRDRAVTAADYEFLAAEATTDVVIVRALPPRLQEADGAGSPAAWKKGDPWAFAGISRAPGTVNLVVVPDQGPAVPQPAPTPDLVREIQTYLDARRDLSARLTVVGPRYLPIIVKAEVTFFPQAPTSTADQNKVKADMLDKIKAFLHPARGGPDGRGWQVGQPVVVSDLFRAITPPEDTAFLSSLLVKPDIPVYHLPPLNPAGTAGNWSNLERPFALSDYGAAVRVADYELVCSAADSLHTITVILASS
jgi:predicted phage baseplate assembly protein